MRERESFLLYTGAEMNTAHQAKARIVGEFVALVLLGRTKEVQLTAIVVGTQRVK